MALLLMALGCMKCRTRQVPTAPRTGALAPSGSVRTQASSLLPPSARGTCPGETGQLVGSRVIGPSEKSQLSGFRWLRQASRPPRAAPTSGPPSQALPPSAPPTRGTATRRQGSRQAPSQRQGPRPRGQSPPRTAPLSPVPPPPQPPSATTAMEDVMRRRQAEATEAYEGQWDGGAGSHHPDFDPEAMLFPGVARASRCAWGGCLTRIMPRVWERAPGS
jgi:hypothetical protein